MQVRQILRKLIHHDVSMGEVLDGMLYKIAIKPH